jgi:hypothetical protein
MANSALLVMDVQRDVVAIADDGSGYLPRLRRAIDGARAAGITVIYVVLELRPGDPEVSPRNKVLTNVVRAGLFTEGAPGTEIHDDVAPQQGDVVVTKSPSQRTGPRRPSAPERRAACHRPPIPDGVVRWADQYACCVIAAPGTTQLPRACRAVASCSQGSAQTTFATRNPAASAGTPPR